MARRSNRYGVALVAAIVMIVLDLHIAYAAAPSGPTDLGGTQSRSLSDGRVVRGWILTKSSPVPARLSVANNGCGGCTWLIFRQCSDGVPGVASPEGTNCQGPDVSCGPAEARNWIYFSPDPGTPRKVVASYCYLPTQSELISADTVVPDARKYADQVSVDKPKIHTWPPGNKTLVNLPTFVAISATDSASSNFGGQGYTMRLRVAAAEYLWDFGDGATIRSNGPGGPPPEGPVHHTYRQSGPETITATVEYGATYSLVTPFGTIGPLEVPGGPVRSLPVSENVLVQESIATLTK